MNCSSLFQFFKDHWDGPVAALVFLAFVMTMPLRLPWPLNKVDAFNWSWEWIHDALNVFVSMRGGGKIPPPQVTPPTGDSNAHAPKNGEAEESGSRK